MTISASAHDANRRSQPKEDPTLLGLHLLNMQNVLLAMKDDSQNVLFMKLHSTKEKTSLYYGLSKRVNAESDVSTHEYAEVLRQTAHGNFLGVKCVRYYDDIFDEVLDYAFVR